jgi:hypothetical protein
MGFKREVTRVEEMDYGIGNIAPERLSAPRGRKNGSFFPHAASKRGV